MTRSKGRVEGLLWTSSHTAAPETGGSCLRDPGHSHKWFSLVNPAGRSILVLSHQETRFVGTMAHADLVGLTSTCQMNVSCWFFCTNRSCCLHWSRLDSSLS